MAFMTFILMICLSRGVGDQFQPDYIGKYSTYCLMISVIEVLVVKFALYFVNVKSISFLDLVSYCCYKYVGLCIVLTLDLTIEGGNLLLMLMKIYVAYTSGLLIHYYLNKYQSSATSTMQHTQINLKSFSVNTIHAVIGVSQIFIVWLLARFSGQTGSVPIRRIQTIYTIIHC
eukprot:TRINITY_DN87_c0_g1_i5.p1 TRINITY_DN87_c0_g1~~TRINITY_DN87_c0_g1_i5.p1  ORF type:complete len:173 (-),score=26.47 TRINITY_DN87_c0_g1_i5:240-758(-)